MTADCHLHTCFSDDSDTPPEDMAERAIALGMKSICIMIWIFPAENMCWTQKSTRRSWPG